MIKLSIITINYNNVNGLQKTINSVINQTLKNFEFIIIDGCSTDNSTDLLKKFAGQINYSTSEPDNGIYNAMNKGIRHANGEYCFFLNSGDWLVNNYILDEVFKSDNNVDIIFGNLFVTSDNKVIGKAYGKNDLSFYDVYSGVIKHQATFFRRTLFDRFGLYNEKFKIISDREYFIRTIGLGGASYKYLDIDIACFDNGGISNNSGEIVSWERQEMLDHYIPAMIQKDYLRFENISEYEPLTKISFTRFFLRLMRKSLKLLNVKTIRK